MRSGIEIDGYFIEEKLGEGGMGEVWRARPVGERRAVAIKLLQSQYCRNPAILDRFQREARAQMELDHANIVPVLKLVNFRGRPGFVLPFYQRGSLADYIRPAGGPAGKPLPLRDVFSIAKDVLRGLDFAHQSGWIHCDVKPSNILLDSGGRACISDFGVALEMVRLNVTTRGVIGTPQYMSPEQSPVGGKFQAHRISHLTDVYSFGCCLFEMLTGESPSALGGRGPGRLPAAALEKVPGPLRRLIADAVTEDLAKRIGGCPEFLLRLEAIEERINRSRFRRMPRFWPPFGRAAAAIAGTVLILSAGHGIRRLDKPVMLPPVLHTVLHAGDPAPALTSAGANSPSGGGLSCLH